MARKTKQPVFHSYLETDYAIACMIYGVEGGLRGKDGAKWLASCDNVHQDTVFAAIPYGVRVTNVIDIQWLRNRKEECDCGACLAHASES